MRRGCHFAAAEHFEVGRTDDSGVLDTGFRIGVAAGMRCHCRLSMQLLDDELGKGVGVVSRVSTNGLDRQGETAKQGAKQRHGEFFAVPSNASRFCESRVFERAPASWSFTVQSDRNSR